MKTGDRVNVLYAVAIGVPLLLFGAKALAVEWPAGLCEESGKPTLVGSGAEQDRSADLWEQDEAEKRYWCSKIPLLRQLPSRLKVTVGGQRSLVWMDFNLKLKWNPLDR